MTPDKTTATAAEAERWFVDHGLPWFVDDVRERVLAGLSRRRLVRLAIVAGILGAAGGAAVGWWSGDVSLGVAVGLTVLGLLVATYAAASLHGLAVARWAARRTMGSLGLLFPLASRALPMLLLFMTFLFINTEVWQVTSRLDAGVMWASVMIFALIGVGFLLVRLPEELDVFDEEITSGRLIAACQGTPLEQPARELEQQLSDEELHRHSDVVGLERANLVLVLLVTQAVQVMLLSLAVWLFFLVFGGVAIDDEVIGLWVGGDAPTYVGQRLVSRELIRTSTFLAAFAGLYFTVYAVTDGTYRKQFFTSITRELERAVSVRLVYRRLRD